MVSCYCNTWLFGYLAKKLYSSSWLCCWSTLEEQAAVWPTSPKCKLCFPSGKVRAQTWILFVVPSGSGGYFLPCRLVPCPRSCCLLSSRPLSLSSLWPSGSWFQILFPWDTISRRLHAHLQQSTWSQGTRGHQKVHLAPTRQRKPDLMKRHEGAQKLWCHWLFYRCRKKMCAPSARMYYRNLTACMCQSKVAQLSCFYLIFYLLSFLSLSTAAVQLMRHAHHPRRWLPVSQVVPNKQHEILRPVSPSNWRCAEHHAREQVVMSCTNDTTTFLSLKSLLGSNNGAWL